MRNNQVYHLFIGIAVCIQVYITSGQFVTDGGFNYCTNLDLCLTVIDKGCTSGQHTICIKLIDSSFCQSLMKSESTPGTCPVPPQPASAASAPNSALGTEICHTVPDSQVGDIGFYLNDGPEVTGGDVTSLSSDILPASASCTPDVFGLPGSSLLCGDAVVRAGDTNKYSEIKFPIPACTATTVTPVTVMTPLPTTPTSAPPPTSTTGRTPGSLPTTAPTVMTTTTATPTKTSPQTTTTQQPFVELPVIPVLSPAAGCTLVPGTCSVTCGTGSQWVVKTCGGRSLTQAEPCTLPNPCTVPTQQATQQVSRNGGYGPWSQWSACSQSCFTLGLSAPEKVRIRICDMPGPSNGGRDCVNSGLGEAEERTSCTNIPVCLLPSTQTPTIGPPIVFTTVRPLCGYNERPCGRGRCCGPRSGSANKSNRSRGKGRQNKTNSTNDGRSRNRGLKGNMGSNRKRKGGGY